MERLALMLAESGNLMLLPNRQRDQGDWIKETKVMIDLAATAYRAALAKDMDGILAVNDKLGELRPVLPAAVGGRASRAARVLGYTAEDLGAALSDWIGRWQGRKTV